MALKIRLARGGAKKRPYYRIVVADIRSPRDGRFIEKLGRHNPMLPKDHEDRVFLNEERIKYWLGVGAKPTDRVQRLLSAAGLYAERDIPVQTKKHLPGEKAQERVREAEEKVKEAAEAAAAEAAAPAEEAPAEEAAAEEAPAEEAEA